MTDSTALMLRFLASARERLTTMSEVVAGLAAAPDRDERVKRLSRDLHTIKGEARLLGAGEIERLAHAGEDMLSAERTQGLSMGTEELLFETIDTLFACVMSRTQGEPLPAAALHDTLARLGHGEGSPATAKPAAGEPTGGEELAREAAHNGQRFLRVELQLIHHITDLASAVSGGLVRGREHLTAVTARQERILELLRRTDGGEEVAEARKLLAEVEGELRALRENDFRLGITYAELADSIRAARLQPLATVFSEYPSFVRRSAREEGKQIRVELLGMDLGVDQQVLAELSAPGIHLLRNSIVHGIEAPAERRAHGKAPEGVITIAARHDGNLVRIEFADDGAGIDRDRVVARGIELGLVPKGEARLLSPSDIDNLVFVSGFSTLTRATDLAGRGVGLDAVRTVVDRMGGSVAIANRPGAGVTFTLTVPTSLSLTRSLLVRTCDQVFALPAVSVLEVLSLPVSEIRHGEGHETVTYRDRVLPLVRLREALGLTGIKDLFVNKVAVVVLRSGDDLAGFVVDALVGERELVVRPFGAFLGRPRMTTGVTLLENGDVVLVLHAADLLRALRGERVVGAKVATDAGKAAAAQRRVLFVEDSVITREYAADVLRARGFVVSEASDGAAALDLLARESFDVVLTDLQMPRLDGFALTAAIRRDPRTKNLPVVVLSTLDSPENRRMALDAGADAYLAKSAFAADLLVDLIAQVSR